MPLRFRTRRFNLVSGLRVNVGRRGASLSIGHRNAWWMIGPRGGRRWGCLGRGFFWTERVPPAAVPHGGHRLAFVVVVAVGALVWLSGL